MKSRFYPIIIASLVALFILSQSLYTVKEGEIAIKMRVGQIVTNNIQPGIHFKIPFIESKYIFDARLRSLDAAPERVLTKEKKQLLVDYFIGWRIVDPQKYWVNTRGNDGEAERIISQIAIDDLRSSFAKRKVNEVVSKDRSQVMDEITKSLASEVKAQGMQVVDVRVKRVDFSNEIKDNVFERMQAERKRVSDSLRAQGREQARTIIADTDRQVQVILANAERDAAITRGEGEAQATSIYAESFGQDSDFYRFSKSLEAYQNAFSNKDNTFITSPDGDFFQYLKKPTAGKPDHD